MPSTIAKRFAAYQLGYCREANRWAEREQRPQACDPRHAVDTTDERQSSHVSFGGRRTLVPPVRPSFIRQAIRDHRKRQCIGLPVIRQPFCPQRAGSSRAAAEIVRRQRARDILLRWGLGFLRGVAASEAGPFAGRRLRLGWLSGGVSLMKQEIAWPTLSEQLRQAHPLR